MIWAPHECGSALCPGQQILELLRAIAEWKTREDGLVFSDEPLDDYLAQARALLARLERPSA